MAGDWIKMRTNLSRSPQVVRIAYALNADRLRVIGGLHAVWSLADEQTEDGVLAGYDYQTVDEMIGWQGFCEALETVDWVRKENGGISFPRYEEHNGQTAKRRAQEANRKASARRPQLVRSLSAPNADEKRTREEKRRDTPVVPPHGFELFWAAWPAGERKQAKGKCLEVWRKLDCEAEADKIVSHVESLKPSSDWQRGYDPAPLVYLNQRRWQGAEVRPVVRKVAL